MMRLETERLRLREFRDSDIDAYAAMCADGEVMRYLTAEGATLSREDAWRQMAMLAGHWSLRGYGTWALEERASGRFVGRVGLHYPEGWPEREVGWTLAREFWGRGYASESARRAIEYAFETLGWTRLVSVIYPGNQRSIALALRLGETFSHESVVRGVAVHVYALERKRWAGRAPGTKGPMDYVDELVELVRRTAARLRLVPDGAAATRPAPGKWCAKELVGHLIDSASNNHQRFMRARWQDDLVFQGYDQDAWVREGGYAEAPWDELVTLWEADNLQLARVMRGTPEDVRLRPRGRHNLDVLALVPVPANVPATLDGFMRDYVGHVRHHVAQLDALGLPQ